ncbi:MAG: cation-transporting P-type ATPase [bacterium]|nr:cation-transporting P-type ATPase [bacterium]
MRGLTTAQAREARSKSGPNILPEPRRATSLVLFFRQFAHPFVLILMVASILALVFGATIDAVFILAIVAMIGIVGFLQEYKAERTIAALKRMVMPEATVFRDGEKMRLAVAELVPGDVVEVQTGERISADGFLVESHNLEVDESALTGESLAVEKQVDDAAQERAVFMGTTVVNGRGLFKVTAIGGETAFGKIVQSLKTIEDDSTPLEKQLQKIAKQLALLAIAVAGVITLLDFLNARPLADVMLTNISIAIAVVPEGLPVILTVALAVGAQRMAAKKAAVRRMSAVESFGDVDVICTDKTGTLTTGKMRVDRTWVFQGEKDMFLRAMVLCNTAMVVQKVNHGSSDFFGDPTEIALLQYAQEQNVSIEQTRTSSAVVHEFSFDQKRKMMSVVVTKGSGALVFSKGAPDVILAASYLSPKQREDIQKEVTRMVDKGLRVLGVAVKEERSSKKEHWNRDLVEHNLTFLGLVGMIDPPRSEVAAAIQDAVRAGIRVVMVTGDHEKTARYVAEKVGLLQQGDEIMTGEQLERVNEMDLPTVLSRVRIFARTTPLQKLRIVRGFQRMGKLTAVTGDGVNDAPALKQADVGIAMGQTGTDVARNASDIVLTDDNFSTIIAAVAEGRKIATNVRTAARFLLICNIGEGATIIGAAAASLLPAFAGIPTPLVAVQLLWMNLVADGFPALALALESHTDRSLSSFARQKNSAFLSLRPLFLWGGVLGGIIALVYVLSWRALPLEYARTLTFTLLVCAQLFVAFFVRVSHGPFWRNPFLLLTVLVSLALQVMIVTHPFFQRIFHTVPLW